MFSDDERRSYGFGLTWGWVINDNFYFWVNYLIKLITNGECLYLFECGNNICILLQDLSGYLYWVELVQGLQTLLNVLQIERKQKTQNDTRGLTHHVIFTRTASAVYRLNSTAFWKFRGHVWFIKYHWIYNYNKQQNLTIYYWSDSYEPYELKQVWINWFNESTS